MKVQFIYIGDKYDKDRETIVTNVCELASEHLNLPQYIEVEFKSLKDNVHGETILDPRFKNRIRLNENLLAREVIGPLVHELLHLNQTFTGKLSYRRDGNYIWENKPYMVPENPTYNDWSKYPWEVDVVNKQQLLVQKIIESYNNREKSKG